MNCPYCRNPVFRKSSAGDKLKARLGILVLRKGGEVETNCPTCGKAILLPLGVDPTKDVRPAGPLLVVTIPKGS